jgi:signal transduction histidine kinase
MVTRDHRQRIRHKIMETKLTRLSRQYTTALRKHLKQERGASLHPAQRLGRGAMASGLEALDLTRIHEIAIARLVSPSYTPAIRKRMIKQAEIFFVEAITPIETTHRAVQEAKVLLNRRNGTVDLAVSNRCLKLGIVQRKAAEKAFKKSGEHFTQLLKESRQLQKHLRYQTHQIMSAQEDERGKISRELYDEVAQTLLGINVRLLMLKKGAASNTKGLKNEIASTQRLLKESVQSINRFAHDLDIHHRA